jgi:hypothetical protein
MHSSRSDKTGTSAGRFQTNVYTKKRRKLKITRELVAASDCAAAQTTAALLIGPLLDADTCEGVAELVQRAFLSIIRRKPNQE